MSVVHQALEEDELDRLHADLRDLLFLDDGCVDHGLPGHDVAYQCAELGLPADRDRPTGDAFGTGLESGWLDTERAEIERILNDIKALCRFDGIKTGKPSHLERSDVIENSELLVAIRRRELAGRKAGSLGLLALCASVGIAILLWGLRPVATAGGRPMVERVLGGPMFRAAEETVRGILYSSRGEEPQASVVGADEFSSCAATVGAIRKEIESLDVLNHARVTSSGSVILKLTACCVNMDIGHEGDGYSSDRAMTIDLLAEDWIDCWWDEPLPLGRKLTMSG